MKEQIKLFHKLIRRTADLVGILLVIACVLFALCGFW